jgi:hypothetical protein
MRDFVAKAAHGVMSEKVAGRFPGKVRRVVQPRAGIDARLRSTGCQYSSPTCQDFSHFFVSRWFGGNLVSPVATEFIPWFITSNANQWNPPSPTVPRARHSRAGENPAFPRRRESSVPPPFLDSRLRGNDGFFDRLVLKKAREGT